jgi:F0F1-type ATP synthase delta subunit
VKQPATEAGKRKKTVKKWSAKVTTTSNALDLENDVFMWTDAAKIAASLKKSALQSRRRKGTPYQSAMSILNFYINRAGHNLPDKQKEVLELAKNELRRLFGRVA